MAVVQAAPVSLTEEEEWDLQMKKLEEVDRWTKLAEENVPPSLSDSLLGLIKKFPGLQRIPSFQLMGFYNWSEEILSPLTNVLYKIPHDKVLQTIDFLLSLVESDLHFLGLRIFDKLRSEYVIEWSTILALNEGHYLMQVARHLPEVELDLMIYNIHELNIRELINMTQYIIEHPESRKCDLCRQKRIYALEFRMRTEQIPSNHLPTVGITTYLSRNEQVYSADDEKQFSFDTNIGQIFWNKSFPVNLIEICDKCLLDAHHAISNQGKYTSIYHIDGATRKDLIVEQRVLENALATIVIQVSKERKYRRLKEFAIQAIELQRKGLKKEANDRENIRIQLEREEESKRKVQERKELNEQILSVDDKWLESDQRTNLESLEKRKAYTMLKYHLGFDALEAPAPVLRKRRTWRLQDFDEAGLPLTKEGANKMFGLSRDFDHDDAPAIDFWKIIAMDSLERLKEKEAERKRQLRDQELKEYDTLKNYVRERIITMERYHSQQRHISEEFEKNRLYERQLARQERQQEKFQLYLQYEQQCMGFEDYRSYRLRELYYEQIRENVERENMFNEELEQTEIDKFWGIDAYHLSMHQEEDRLNEFYMKRVQEKNRQLTEMKCIRAVPKSYFQSYLPKITKNMKLLKEDENEENEILRRQQQQKQKQLLKQMKKSGYQLAIPHHSGFDSPSTLSVVSSSSTSMFSPVLSRQGSNSSITSLPPINGSNNNNNQAHSQSQPQLPPLIGKENNQVLNSNNIDLSMDKNLLKVSSSVSFPITEEADFTKVASPMSKPLPNNHTSSAIEDDGRGIVNKARQELYEFQFQLNQLEDQKRLNYLKKLKAEELRMKAQLKIRAPLHEPK
jgi:hypothetical protein